MEPGRHYLAVTVSKMKIFVAIGVNDKIPESLCSSSNVQLGRSALQVFSMSRILSTFTEFPRQRSFIIVIVTAFNCKGAAKQQEKEHKTIPCCHVSRAASEESEVTTSELCPFN